MNKILIFIVLCVVSCAPTSQTINPLYFNKNLPELNKEMTKDIGVPLTSKEEGNIYNAIQLNENLTIKPGGIKKDIPANTILLNDKIQNGFKLYTAVNDPLVVIGISEKDGHMALHRNNNFIRMQQLKYTELTHPTMNASYFRQEFIYNGKVNNGLRFIYREFNNDYARPAYTQELQYDLSESSIVGFKGLRIEILDVSNTQIKYKVISHFD